MADTSRTPSDTVLFDTKGLALAEVTASLAGALSLQNGEITDAAMIHNAILALLLSKPSEGTD